MKVFEEVVLLKTRFHKVKVQQLIEYVLEAAKTRKKAIVSNVNIKAMNLAGKLLPHRVILCLQSDRARG